MTTGTTIHSSSHRRLRRWLTAGIGILALAAPATLQAQAADAPATGAPAEQQPAQTTPAAPASGAARGAWRGGQANPQVMIDHLRQVADELNLTDDQKTQVKAILDKAAEDAKAKQEEFQKNNTPPQQRNQEWRTFRQDLQTKIRDVLTPEQRQTLRQKLQEAGGARGLAAGGGAPPATRAGRMGGGPGGGAMMFQRLRTATESLDLTAEQKTQVGSILDEAQKQADSIRAQAAGQSPDERQATMQKVRQLMQETQGKLRNVLTPEQQQKFREQLPGRGMGGQGQGRGQRRGPDANQ